jgi:hypothetical protein
MEALLSGMTGGKMVILDLYLNNLPRSTILWKH